MWESGKVGNFRAFYRNSLKKPNCEKTCENVRRLRSHSHPCNDADATENLLLGQRKKSVRPKRKNSLAEGEKEVSRG